MIIDYLKTKTTKIINYIDNFVTKYEKFIKYIFIITTPIFILIIFGIRYKDKELYICLDSYEYKDIINILEPNQKITDINIISDYIIFIKCLEETKRYTFEICMLICFGILSILSFLHLFYAIKTLIQEFKKPDDTKDD